MSVLAPGASAGLSARAFSPIQIPNMTCWLSTADAIVNSGKVVSITSRVGSLLFTANPNQVTYVASDSNVGGRPSCTTTSDLGFTFSSNLVPPGSARTVVAIGYCATSTGGVTLLQMSGEDAHRLCFVRTGTVGTYIAFYGSGGIVYSANTTPAPTTVKCTIWTMSSTRDVTCDEGNGNLVTNGSPITADDTGSTVSGGKLLTTINGIFSSQFYSLAELLVYNRVLNVTETTMLRKYSTNLYGVN